MADAIGDIDDGGAVEQRAERVTVYLDDREEPIAEYAPPARLQLDTRSLADGEHELRIEACGADGEVGERHVSFEVRNGPAISVEGVADGDVVEGDLDMLVHAWGGADAGDWEPERAESPAPIPTWAWVLLIGIIAWAVYYTILYWQPPEPYRSTPTYETQIESVDER